LKGDLGEAAISSVAAAAIDAESQKFFLDCFSCFRGLAAVPLGTIGLVSFDNRDRIGKRMGAAAEDPEGWMRRFSLWCNSLLLFLAHVCQVYLSGNEAAVAAGGISVKVAESHLKDYRASVLPGLS
jgi:hypothetical protein